MQLRPVFLVRFRFHALKAECRTTEMSRLPRPLPPQSRNEFSVWMLEIQFVIANRSQRRRVHRQDTCRRSSFQFGLIEKVHLTIKRIPLQKDKLFWLGTLFDGLKVRVCSCESIVSSQFPDLAKIPDDFLKDLMFKNCSSRFCRAARFFGWRK